MSAARRRRLPRSLSRPLAALALSVGLGACAPTTRDPGGPSFRAAFSDDGVAWVSAGRACVARAPGFSPRCPALPPAVDVAWQGGDAWAAVPALGAVITLDRAARSVPVGRVVALSATRAYREDGSAVDYSGQPLPGVLGAPSQAITGGDGQDYVVLGGRLVRVPGFTLDAGAGEGGTLNATPDGARLDASPSVVTDLGTYRLRGGRLERLDGAGRVVAAVAHGPGRVGRVGAEIVTVTPAGEVRVWTARLEPR